LRTAAAIAMLCRARLWVAWVPFGRWRNSLGIGGNGGSSPYSDGLAKARQLAAHVEWAATRLPFATKCLPRAMALSWLLRSKGIGHEVILAVRPASLRESADAMHAWVEVRGEKVIGDLPGPWFETLRLGSRAAGPRTNEPSDPPLIAVAKMPGINNIDSVSIRAANPALRSEA